MPLAAPLASSNAGTTTAALSTTALAIPAGATAGSVALYFVQQNGSQTRTVSAAGWNQISNGIVNGNNALTCYKKVLTGADLGTSISTSFAASQTWVQAIVVFPGGLDVNALTAVTTKGTASTAVTFPTVTPTVPDTIDLRFGTSRASTANTAVSHTTPTGFTTLVDTPTTGTGNRAAVYIGYRQLSGQSGVAQSTASSTSSTATANATWALTVAPTGVESWGVLLA